MPCAIIDIVKLDAKRSQQSGTGQCIIVALNNGEIRLYSPKDKNLIHVLKNEVVIFIMTNIGCGEWLYIWYIWKRRRFTYNQQQEWRTLSQDPTEIGQSYIYT